ncbi:hypothetical protein PCE01_03260 [Pediococcus cellicola]|nr:hypothetical protein PCE01_03260 [Pediococcus cellicola]
MTKSLRWGSSSATDKLKSTNRMIIPHYIVLNRFICYKSIIIDYKRHMKCKLKELA